MLRQRLTIGLVFAALLGTMISVWWISVGNPIDYFTHSIPPGQALYIFCKLAGLVVFGLLWLQCLLALAQRAPVLKAFPSLSLISHKWLGLAVLVGALLHFGLFFGAVTLRTGQPAWDLFLPQFTAGYYKLHISLGLLGLWLLGLGIYAGWKTSRGHIAWRKLHMVGFVVFGLVFWHAFTIGSESRYGAMQYVWWFFAASLTLAALSRVYGAWRGRKIAGEALPRPEPSLASDEHPRLKDYPKSL